MSEGDSFKEEAVHLGPTYQRNLEQLRRLGFIRRRRLRGDYKVTEEGWVYLNDVVQRDDEVREQLSRNAEKWESGEMTEVQREMARIELIFFGLSRDMGREAETSLESSDPAAWLEALGLESGLLRDEDWQPLEGWPCRVTAFRPFPDAEDDWRLPYAAIEIESSALAEPTIGYITHQLDFQHVSEAFEARGTADDKEVIVVWSKSDLHPAAGPGSRGMPGLTVCLCPKHSYELGIDRNFRPELEGEERRRAMAPIVRWEREPEELR
jgi:hypothetical protein